ncbi:hypothetical protein Bca4012_001446 [Brassica carinata]
MLPIMEVLSVYRSYATTFVREGKKEEREAVTESDCPQAMQLLVLKILMRTIMGGYSFYSNGSERSTPASSTNVLDNGLSMSFGVNV